MSDKGAPIPLPEPTRARWQPLRLGLIELYHYDVEEFWFRDGHLLLRGNNGTGKSKVLSLTLPFLLDGSMSASRVEPDGDRSKRMEWNLLMNKRHERRIGYTWIEFGRRTESGETQTVTLGCGLRAIAGRSHVDPWFFLTEQRIGADLWLTTKERTALSRERLIEAIGSRGQVFDTAQAYRRAIDERLFRLGTERYAALVDTLIQLRQPQLSKHPDEDRLSDALTEALPPLDRAALEDVAEAMSELDDIRRGLNELEAMRKAVTAFGVRYRRYAEIATRRRARSLRQAQTEYDNASRELNSAQRELDEARAAVAKSQNDVQQFEEQLAADTARLDVLRAHPMMREAVRIGDARTLAAQCRASTAEAESRVSAASQSVAREEGVLSRRRQLSEQTRDQLNASHGSAARLAAETGLEDVHAKVLDDIAFPDGVGAVPASAIGEFIRLAREGESRRREQIGVARKRLRELDSAEQLCARARDRRTACADLFDEATESARLAVERLRDAGAQLLAGWRRHCGALQVLRVPEPEDRLGEFETWLGTLAGPNPMRQALDRARQAHEQRTAAGEAELQEERKKLTAEQAGLTAEQARLETGEDLPPSVTYTRDPSLRAGRAGAPLWRLVDFAGHVPVPMRAGLEASLEAAGLLDAWVLPDGVVRDARTHDAMLTSRSARPESLAQWLVLTIPATGPGAEVQEKALYAALESIACGNKESLDAEAWVSPTGEFRLGGLRGAWSKPAAQYIGHVARETARRVRLAEIGELLARVAAALSACDEATGKVAVERQRAGAEYDSAPSDDALLRASADQSAAEQRRREAQVRLGEAQSRLSTAENACERARDALAMDAQGMNVPATGEELDALAQRLGDYRNAATELAEAMRRHQSALVELAEQQERGDEARQALESTIADHQEKLRLLRAADETVDVLQTTIGKPVEELLQQIAATDGARQAHDRALKDARALLVVVSGHRGTAQQKCTDLTEKLEERSGSRKRAIEELQAFGAETGFLAIALPDADLPDTASPWGVDAALTLARRAEQILVGVDSADAVWERIQREVGHDLTELQSSMSAQGHSATVEPSEFGLIVRIVYQQRPERPDTLERQLIAELEEQRLILSVQERSVLEEHLEKEIAANLQKMMSETETRVEAINAELDKRPTSTGVRYRLDWQVLPEDSESGVVGLAEARKRLLKTSPDAWSAQEREQVGKFLQERINAQRQREDEGTLFDSLSRALDYRKWHRFAIERKQYGQWKPLSGPASSGERALGLTVPLFAAASSHYESADAHAPRLVLLDEAFAGIDDEARASCMGLIREFDLDFVMTSEREWGCYPELPGLSICQLVRREGMETVFVSRWTWDGRTRQAEEDPVRRFPEAETADG